MAKLCIFILPKTAEERYNLAKSIPYLGFNINDFCYKIAGLYSFYKLWFAIKTKDKKIINKFKANYSIPGKNIEEALTYYIDNSFDNNFKIKPAFDKDDKTFKLQIYTHNNQLNAALFQLYNLMTLDDISTDENENLKFQHLKECNYCKNIFWAKDSKGKYCSPRCRKNAWYHKNKNTK